MNLNVCVVIGGRDMVVQGKELADRPHVVVSTPGRYIQVFIVICFGNVTFSNRSQLKDFERSDFRPGIIIRSNLQFNLEISNVSYKYFGFTLVISNPC